MSSLFGATLDEIIQDAIIKNNSLASINEKIQGSAFAIEASDNLKNPKLTITSNSLDSNEKMSQSIVTLQQEIPYYGKLDAEEAVATSNEDLLKEQLKLLKVQLVKKIKQQAYTLWQLQALLGVTDEYIQLTQQNIELYESYASINSSQHMGIMKAELSLSDLRIERSKLTAQIQSTYEELSYLASTHIDKLDIDLSIDTKPSLSELKNELSQNPELGIEDKKVALQSAKLEAISLDNYPNISLLVGYAHREKFDNYFNFGVGITLPIYSTEDDKEQIQQAELLSSKSKRQDTVLLIDAKLGIYYAQMLSAYEIYHIVHDDALPKVEHMFELSSASVSTGADLFKYIDVLFTKLSLEKKSILAVASYHKNKANIEALTGALQ
ncbi:TolC family protein [Sulfurimonas sp. C5]|uniref:TolC family protein n=1 Tax=Sulfurimonas sp. C5 TaxID=3036947 RepID=UPI00245588B2|nr:TolC family protein [Sulfurimonas sp. C5]MDH4944298.1 TolC family protein [Sulfurimonas sp. C5]